MPYPVFLAGQVLTASMLQGLQWSSVSQGTDQDVVSSLTFVNSSIVIPVAAGATYRFQLLVNYVADATGDIKFRWTVPSSGSVNRFTSGPGNSATGGSTNFTTTNWRLLSATITNAVGGAGTGSSAYFEEGTIGGGIGGDAILQFSQFSSTAVASTLSAPTTCWFIRVQ